MTPYLVHLKCVSPYLTPWRSCTLWGRLSWIVASGGLKGWTIERWIAAYDADTPPLVVGDGLPFDAVPVPHLLLESADVDEAGKEAQNNHPKSKPKTLTWDSWQTYVQSGQYPADSKDLTMVREDRTHVVLDRSSGTALEGQLRTESGDQPRQGIFFIALVDDSLGEAGLRELVNALCKEGWGYGRSYGYGALDLYGMKPISLPSRGDYMVTLGHCHPDDSLPQEGAWRWTGVRVRPHDAESRKGPKEFFTTMLRPAACFKGQSERGWVGRMMRMDGRSDYRHYGLAPVWPLTSEGAKHG